MKDQSTVESGTYLPASTDTKDALNPQLTADSQSTVNILRHHSLRGATKCNFYPAAIQGLQLSNLSSPEHLSSSIWLEAEDVPGPHVQWVNRSFLEMRTKGRWLAQQGLEIAAIMGEACPSLFPFSSSSGDDDVNFWTVSRWAARFVDNFTKISHSDRLACWIVMFVAFRVRSHFDFGRPAGLY
jgi:hypothetical protein